jgi:fatty acyl-ACP thioesterase A
MHVTPALTNRLFEIQEAACNHVLTIGYGAFHGMNDERLITVTTRMHIEVDRYPAW